MDFPGPDGTGHHLSSVARDGLDGPFLLMGSDGANDNAPSWSAFRKNTRGRQAELLMTGSRHGAYSDAPALLPELVRQGAVPRAALEGNVGTVRPERAVAAVRAYVASFFDRFLKGRDDHLLDGPSDRYPELRHKS
ncbi:hypothetical protein ACFQ2B_19400 [Streptomyces stramineus]